MNKKLILLAIFLISSDAIGDGGWYEGWSEEQLATLKDPVTRNENISNTIVDVQTRVLSEGNYLYEYSVNSSVTNLGTILSMTLDVSCDQPSTVPLGYPVLNSFSENGKHLILGGTHSEYPDSFAADITANNEASWSLLLKPSEVQSGLILISSEPPTERQYQLHALMDTYGWAYHLYTEDDPSLPWSDDFKVIGTILGPRCSTDTSPIPDDPNSPPDDGGDNGSGDGTDDGDTTPTDCKKGKATGHEIGLGHEISNGKHLGHEHNCE